MESSSCTCPSRWPPSREHTKHISERSLATRTPFSTRPTFQMKTCIHAGDAGPADVFQIRTMLEKDIPRLPEFEQKNHGCQ